MFFSLHYTNYGRIAVLISVLLLVANLTYLNEKQKLMIENKIASQNSNLDQFVVKQEKRGDDENIEQLTKETIKNSPITTSQITTMSSIQTQDTLEIDEVSKKYMSYERNSEDMPFPRESRFSCKLPERKIPTAFWETREDWESGSTNHLAYWFCAQKPDQEKRLSTIKYLLDHLTSAFQFYGVEHWIDRGTLLGSVRNGSLIPWDVDADIGLTFESLKKLLSLAFFPDFKFDCNDCTLVFRKGKNSHVIPFKFISVPTGVYIDAFLYFRETVENSERSNFSTFWPLEPSVNNRWSVPSEVIYPLTKSCQIDNSTYWCPSDSITYTALWYGEDWQTPKSVQPKI